MSRRAICLSVIGLFVLAAGCSGGSGPVASNPTTSDSSITTPTPTVDVEANDRAAIEAIWVEYWIVYIGLNGVAPENRAAALEPITVDPVYSNTLKAADENDANGEASYGAMVHHVFWRTPIDGSDFASLRDCLDARGVGLFDVASGEIKTAGVVNYLTVGQFKRQPDDTWRLSQILFLETTPCTP